MADDLPRLYVVRHGDTEWSDLGRHTGRTDIPLTGKGEERARELAETLRSFTVARVFTSPLVRARRTCELAGFGAKAEIDLDLLEWNYGRYEGKTSSEIRADRPGWEMFRDGCPDGETAREVGVRADRFIERARAAGVVVVFAHGHILRTIAARWLGLPPESGRCFFCAPASIGELSFEHGSLDQPIIRVWNFARTPWN
ncbi:MAG TPA: histidine phosphatase family protein [Gemmataceae bacterium]|nr:histidine phosphatase family protein [Gemmataceae bacterium]